MDSLADRWETYFETERGAALEAAAGEYPSTQSVRVDLVEVHAADGDLARALLEEPDRALSTARTVLRELTAAPGPVLVRLENNPHLCDVAEVAARHLHDLVTVQGAVESVDPVRASVVTARYDCPACEAALSTAPTGIDRAAPTRCTECGWDGDFEFRPARYEFVDTQRLSLGSADSPADRSLPAYLHGDLVGQVTAGDHVGMTGVLRARHRADTALHVPYLDGCGLREERDISPPDSLEAALDSYWEP